METLFAILPFILIIIVGFLRFVILKQENDYKNRYIVIPIYLIAAFVMLIDTYQEFSRERSYFFIIIVCFPGYLFYKNFMQQRSIELEKRKNEGLIN